MTARKYTFGGKEAGLKISTEHRTTLMYHHLNARQNQNIKTAKNVGKLKYLDDSNKTKLD